jgi:hypothetical protein
MTFPITTFNLKYVYMIKFIRYFFRELEILFPFSPALRPLKLTRLVEKFDVVARVPAYAPIKVR